MDASSHAWDESGHRLLDSLAVLAATPSERLLSL